ncbi:ASCH domain-containing protein [Paenibacillus sp. 481]|uniref:ASCH domain-containing protein n=1 Tax=Paenibacillus sp. 481 TaxID=2835869 RepID=UPI001E51A7FD|nr:ASCH domain-containing protein [Paenibacillus sp. 481]UHA74687.1 ASCH domain-containing protein [Paenibacillus sp. 481]
MNKAAQAFWEKYWGNSVRPSSVSEWKFGDTPDRLAEQVVAGVKTATCSGHVFYELENMPLPVAGQYGVILNGQDEPVAIVKTIEVSLTPLNEVTEAFALEEGDGTYDNWRSIHVNYFRSELQKVGLEFSEDMLLVCERFERIDVTKNDTDL